jgi:hypothetical protein
MGMRFLGETSVRRTSAVLLSVGRLPVVRMHLQTSTQDRPSPSDAAECTSGLGVIFAVLGTGDPHRTERLLRSGPGRAAAL